MSTAPLPSRSAGQPAQGPQLAIRARRSGRADVAAAIEIRRADDRRPDRDVVGGDALRLDGAVRDRQRSVGSDGEHERAAQAVADGVPIGGEDELPRRGDAAERALAAHVIPRTGGREGAGLVVDGEDADRGIRAVGGKGERAVSRDDELLG